MSTNSNELLDHLKSEIIAFGPGDSNFVGTLTVGDLRDVVELLEAPTSALRAAMEENARMREALKALNKELDFAWPYSDTKPWIPMGNPEIEALNAAFSLARAALEQESKDE